jgi:hypothetical protein
LALADHDRVALGHRAVERGQPPAVGLGADDLGAETLAQGLDAVDVVGVVVGDRG